MAASLERELLSSLLALYEKWKTIGYTAVYFKRMLTTSDKLYKGPVGKVKHLLGKNLSDKSGFERLRRAKKLDWTVEYLLTDTNTCSSFCEREGQGAPRS